MRKKGMKEVEGDEYRGSGEGREGEARYKDTETKRGEERNGITLYL